MTTKPSARALSISIIRSWMAAIASGLVIVVRPSARRSRRSS
ncbi:MAG TPA: hypothetical protein PLW80_09185 [Spirochaetales bacterium]|nr:hypothetical protein [Spirochaetales bacterium]